MFGNDRYDYRYVRAHFFAKFTRAQLGRTSNAHMRKLNYVIGKKN